MLADKADAFNRDELTHRVLTPVIGRTSLFLAEGPDWRWQRRAVAPIFRHEMLLSFVPTVAVIAERQVERWRARPLDVPVEIAAAMTRPARARFFACGYSPDHREATGKSFCSSRSARSIAGGARRGYRPRHER